jgi:hypothetical protein
LSAQVVSSTLTGNVTDSSGASVPSALVRATNLATGTVSSTDTTSAGVYNLTFLNPGTYRLEITAQGFKTFSQDNIELAVSTTVRVDATLPVGNATETVTITAESPLLQTDRAEVARNFAPQTVVTLPLANRNYEAMAGTLAGVAPPVENNNSRDPADSTILNVNGQPVSANVTIMDGIDDHDPILGNTVYLPSSELVDEVHISTSNYAAEFGRVGGAVINVVTKGGTNELHGSLYEFNRVGLLTARDFFNVTNPKPGLTRNDFGAAVGGPIRKNKTFFFASYEGLYVRQSTMNIDTLPVAPWLSGNFSAVPSLALYDPNTGNPNGTGRTPFPNNTLPLSDLNPVAQKVIPYFPQPNLSGFLNNYAIALASTENKFGYDGRIDHYFSESTKMFFKVNVTEVSERQDGTLGVIGDGEVANDYTVSSALNFTHSFSPTLLSELRLGYNRWLINVNGEDTTQVTNQTLGLVDPTPDDISTKGIALMLINGMVPGGAEQDTPGQAQIGLGWNYGPELYTDNLFTVVNTWSKVTGKHTFKWGVEIHRDRADQDQPKGLTLGPRGLFYFYPGTTELNGGPALGTYGTFGNSFASFLLGDAEEEGRTWLVTTPTNRQTQFSGFVQDTYQVSHRLTLDIGVRYDLYTTVKPHLPGGAGNYDYTSNTFLIAGYGNVGMSTGVEGRPHNFSPRVGIAYRISDKSVIRTGYAISYWEGYQGFTGGTLSCQFPALGNLQQGSLNTYVVNASLNSLLAKTPFSLPASGTINPAPAQAFFAIPFYNPIPYVESYNFTYQRQLVSSLAWDVGYIGNVGRQEPYAQAYNASVPGTGTAGLRLVQEFGHSQNVTLRGYGVNSNYNSLQTTLSKRLSHGLVATVAYTFSKSLDTATLLDELDIARNYGPSSFDSTHLLTITHQYTLPFGKGERFLSHGGPAAFVFSGWQLNGLYRLSTGNPFTPTSDATSCQCTNNTQFAQVVAPVHYLGGVGPGQPWFSTSSFAAPPANQFGDAGRDIIRGPGISNYDFSVFRKFSVSERFRLEYRAEFYNLTNTPHFALPNAVVTSGTFGIISSTMTGFGNRRIQMALRLTF